MSALGQKRTRAVQKGMSALPPESGHQHNEQKGRPCGGLPNDVAFNGGAITSRRHFPCILPYRQPAYRFCSSRNLPCLFFWHQQGL